MAEGGGMSQKRHRVSWRPTNCCSLLSKCPQFSPFVSCCSLLKYVSDWCWWNTDVCMNVKWKQTRFVSCLCFRSVSLLQMQLQVWSWWRREFLKRSWRCWQYPWCLCRSSYLSSSANTQQGLDLWTSSTKHSHLGWHSDTDSVALCIE